MGKRINILDNIYKNWKVIGLHSGSSYKCQCLNCGNVDILNSYKLRNNIIKKCSECNNDIELNNNVIKHMKINEYLGYGKYKCTCSCGKTLELYGIQLLDKNTQYCKHNTSEKLIEKQESSLNKNAELDEGKYEVNNYKEEHYINIGYSNIIQNRKRELIEELSEYNVLCNVENIIEHIVIDIYSKENNLAILIDTCDKYYSSKINKKYKQNITIAAAKNKVKLIHIFEYEWDDTEKKEKLIKYLKNRLGITESKILYARNTKVVTINSIQEKEFLNKYHLQGYSHSSVCYGMLYENELIAVMSFGKPRFNNNYEWELVRLAYRYDIRVVGGTEKLFKRFITDYNPNNIVSYCDISKFNGGTYLKLGFNTSADSITEPNYVWVEPINNKVLPRYQTMKHKLIKGGLGTQEQTEDEIMTNLGYYKVYDCGNLRFTWTKET